MGDLLILLGDLFLSGEFIMIMIDKNDNSLGDVIHIYTLYPGVPC
jgi:hypothetical protein